MESPYDKVESPGESNETNINYIVFIHQQRVDLIVIVIHEKFSSSLCSPVMEENVVLVSCRQFRVAKTMPRKQID